MKKFFAGVSVLICIVGASTNAADVFIITCENCDYVAEDIVVGFSDSGEIITIGICPGCKELSEVVLEKGDLEGKKKYKCPLCRERLYLYRAISGDPLTEPKAEERYQCPRCGAYGLAVKMGGVGEEETTVEGIDYTTPDP